MRVIAGKYRSRPLRSLRGMEIRPTADRLRETLFNVLTAGNPEALEGSSWLDLFAGTGAVGIEALSRGAAKVRFVESGAQAVEVIRKNLESLGIGSGFEVLQGDVVKSLRRMEGGGDVDFVFLDPPYEMSDAYGATLGLLGESRLVGDGTLVMAEHRKQFEPGEAFGVLKRYRKLQQGDAALSFYRREG
jgi:16S rRNA (guanine966-N2)-methyltransferase